MQILVQKYNFFTISLPISQFKCIFAHIFLTKTIFRMKKFTFTALLACIVLACSPEIEDTIVFDNATADKEVKLSNDEGSPVCAVHLQIATAIEENGYKGEVVNRIIQKRLLNMEGLTMQQAVDSFANTYTSSYLRNLLPIYNQDRADTTKRTWYEYHYVITSEARQGSKSTMAFIATTDYYEGGAHSVNQRTTMNFDVQTGRLIGLNDIFVPGYENLLNAVLQKALCEKVGVADISDLRQKGYLVGMQMFPSENFILEDETISFIYNPSEIAPHTQGETELVIPLSNLEQILRKENKS
jgi:hypothetical protein